MSFAGYNLLPVMPEIVLAIGAMLLLMLGAFRGQQVTGTVTGLALALLVLTGVLIFLVFNWLSRGLLGRWHPSERR
jgi:NADH-quinone oxidoreductase subunit N